LRGVLTRLAMRISGGLSVRLSGGGVYFRARGTGVGWFERLAWGRDCGRA